MARLTNAVWSPVEYPGRLTVIDGVIIHTSVTATPAPAATASFLANGTCIQHRDTTWKPAANSDGNWHLGAFECMDRGPEFGNWNKYDGHAVPGFTSAQRESIADKLAQYNTLHSVPLVMLPNSKVGNRGIGYHRQGVDGAFLTNNYAYPGRVTGGERWSIDFGKVCPGDRRITELIKIILPRARVLAGLDLPPSPTPPPPVPRPEEDIVMATKEEVISGFFSHPDFKALLANSNRTIDLQERILQVLDSDLLPVEDKLRRIRNLILTNSPQFTWGEVSSRTWNDLRQSRWGRVLI